MNDFFLTIQTFIQSLRLSELVLGFVSFILLVSVFYYFFRNIFLEDQVEMLQKNYTPRRKRVYQSFLETYNREIEITSEARTKEALLMHYAEVLNDICLWGGDKVVKAALEFRQQINKDISEEKLRPFVLWMIYSMRKDLGFANKGVKYKTLNKLLQ